MVDEGSSIRTVRHPAKFSQTILSVLREVVPKDALVLDPFAGTGRVHSIGDCTVGVEIEPEWADMHPRTIVGNALALPFPDGTFDAIVTSPTYGNRLADHHNARDASRRHSYTHDLGRTLHPDNSGTLYFWQASYKEFHVKAWTEALRVLRNGGLFFLNASDFIRRGEVQEVNAWHLSTLHDLGLQTIKSVPIETPRLRYGANAAARCECEWIHILTK